jgi:hypothetical protein
VKHQIQFRPHYPKLSLLACSVLLAYLLYIQGFFDMLPQYLGGHGYLSMLLGGMLVGYGFTAPFGVAIFIGVAKDVHPLLGAIAGGIGAGIADITIFTFVRQSFADELSSLKTSAVISHIQNWLYHESVPERIQQYMAWSVAGLLIASPLPDEIGVAMLSGFTELKTRPFSILCFCLHSVGIFIILAATQTLIV